MNNEKLVQEIRREDCVGDSSGKHNFNLLSLDTSICNLSSQFFNVNNNFYQIFNDFAQNAEKFIQASNLFLDPNRFNKISAAVNLLSSYWEKHEFSVHYPLNISTLNNIAISCPTVNQIEEKLTSLAKVFINREYPVKNYIEGTKLNLIFFLYNVPVNPKKSDDLISTKTSPEYSYRIRHMYAEYIRQDVHLGNGKIFRFVNSNGAWTLNEITTGNTDVTKQPILVQTPPPRISVRSGSANGRSVISVTIAEDELNFDLFYRVSYSGLYLPGYTDVTLTINSGVFVGSSVDGGAALTVSGFEVGDSIRIINNGNIIGYGGLGGRGNNLGEALTNENNGKNWGNALALRFPVETIINNGIIAGGGGGGAGGISSYTNKNYIKNLTFAVSDRRATTTPIQNLRGGGGGGGGAGYVGGTFGLGGYGDIGLPPTSSIRRWTSEAGREGTSGDKTTPGLGGSGVSGGGNGGALGQDGVSTGQISIGRQLPPLGGKAGRPIDGESFIVNLTTETTIRPYGDIRGILNYRR